MTSKQKLNFSLSCIYLTNVFMLTKPKEQPDGSPCISEDVKAAMIFRGDAVVFCSVVYYLISVVGFSGVRQIAIIVVMLKAHG